MLLRDWNDLGKERSSWNRLNDGGGGNKRQKLVSGDVWILDQVIIMDTVCGLRIETWKLDRQSTSL